MEVGGEGWEEEGCREMEERGRGGREAGILGKADKEKTVKGVEHK